MSFHWVDYLVFSASLAIGLVIGAIFFCTGGKQKTTKEYLLGGGNMNPVAVGTSLVVSLINAVFLLGGTAEVHYRSTECYLKFVYCFNEIYYMHSANNHYNTVCTDVMLPL